MAPIRSTVPPITSEGTVRVSLLLPLSGANAELGQAMLNAAQMAVFHFADKRFELLTQDTKGTPQGAVRAATIAVGDGASMILKNISDGNLDNLKGKNTHHQIETVFKAFGRALRMAIEMDERMTGITPSTKGSL